jgi:two-component system OmpR family response regulator
MLSSMAAIPKVLVVEDDDAIRTLLVAALGREPFDVHSANDGADALLLTQAHEYAVIILDLMMPRVNGFAFLDALRSASPAARSVIFVITAFDDSVIGKLRADQVHAIIRKPFDVPQLVTMVREVAMNWTGHVLDGLPAVQPSLAEGGETLPADEPIN